MLPKISLRRPTAHHEQPTVVDPFESIAPLNMDVSYSSNSRSSRSNSQSRSSRGSLSNSFMAGSFVPSRESGSPARSPTPTRASFELSGSRHLSPRTTSNQSGRLGRRTSNVFAGGLKRRDSYKKLSVMAQASVRGSIMSTLSALTMNSALVELSPEASLPPVTSDRHHDSQSNSGTNSRSRSPSQSVSQSQSQTNQPLVSQRSLMQLEHEYGDSATSSHTRSRRMSTENTFGRSCVSLGTSMNETYQVKRDVVALLNAKFGVGPKGTGRVVDLPEGVNPAQRSEDAVQEAMHRMERRKKERRAPFGSVRKFGPGLTMDSNSLQPQGSFGETTSLGRSVSIVLPHIGSSPRYRPHPLATLPPCAAVDTKPRTNFNEDLMWGFEIDKINKEARQAARGEASDDIESPPRSANSSPKHSHRTPKSRDGARRVSFIAPPPPPESPGRAAKESDELTKLRQRMSELESELEEVRSPRRKRAISIIEETVSDDYGSQRNLGGPKTGFSGKPELISRKSTKWLRPQATGNYASFRRTLSTSMGKPKFVVEPVDGQVLELDTNMPMQDLHLYQIYAQNKRMTFIFRPISQSVPGLYAGNFFLDANYCDADGMPIPQPKMSQEEIQKITQYECRIKGKGINISLKSSSYPPIDGLIPVNPALGKAYLEAQRREREIENLLLAAQGGVFTINLVRKLRRQQQTAGNSTAAFVRDIERALQDSDVKCKLLMEDYNSRLVLTVDKMSVSAEYINKFNEAQFLGTTSATWRGGEVRYRDLGGGNVERNERAEPYFYVLNGTNFYLYDTFVNELSQTPETETDNLKPVKVVTHRTFFISPTTCRIQEDPATYLIGPDFDGLCYATERTPTTTLEEVIEWAEIVTKPALVKSMGLVSPLDQEHVEEMRQMTEWKQNHGYECHNTVKTQPLTPGPYVTITPDSVLILKDYPEIIEFYRDAWRNNVPLIVNPNWKVAVDSFGLPCVFGEETVLPIVDDCGMAEVMSKIDMAPGTTFESLKAQFIAIEARAALVKSSNNLNVMSGRGFGAREQDTKTARDELLDDVFLVLDKKNLAQLFFEVRRWQLFPPMWDTHRDCPREDFEDHRAKKIAAAMREFKKEEAQFSRLYADNEGATSFLALLVEFIEAADEEEEEVLEVEVCD